MGQANGTAQAGRGRHGYGSAEAAPDMAGMVDAAEAWRLALAVRRRVDAGEACPPELGFDRVDGDWLPRGPRGADIVVSTGPAAPWRSRWPLTPGARDLLDLHLPLAACPRARGFVGALLGQTLDGFIATQSGHSRYINGDASLAHLHRLRALSDAVVIGVGTAVADSPRLTTRHVPGPSPTRVVIDPHGRLPADAGLLRDGAAPTLVIRAAPGEPGERRLSPQAAALDLPAEGGRIEPAAVVAALRDRGLSRLLIEGGGCTVGRFLEAGLLDRLQLAISPVILGAGRPALPIAPAERLDQALRPASRRFLLGEDVLFDLRLRPPDHGAASC